MTRRTDLLEPYSRETYENTFKWAAEHTSLKARSYNNAIFAVAASRVKQAAKLADMGGAICEIFLANSIAGFGQSQHSLQKRGYG